MNPFLTQSAGELAALIRERKVSSREIVDAHIARAVVVNPSLNAIVEDRFAAARDEADAADRKTSTRAPTDLPVFHGVPCTIKECFALTGMPNTSGLVSRKGIRPTADATAVARLRQAGAIPIGVTNVPELCMWMETDNRVYGRTNNPYDTERIVGGSSGGEGAIIGAGASPFGLGSDIGGSIRMPAFFNGVYGHKPTGGMVPSTGQFPMAENEALRYLATGPLARRATDLMPLLRILAGPDGLDKGSMNFTLGDPADVDLRALSVINVVGNGAVKVHPELTAAQLRAAEALARLGAKIKTVSIERLRRSVDIWSAMLTSAGGTPFGTLMGGGGAPINPMVQLALWAVGRSPHTLPAIALAALEKGSKLMEKRTLRMLAEGRALRAELVDVIGPQGVMLYPSYSHPAPKHQVPLLLPLNWVYTAILNVMELPVTQIPLGLGSEGLPLGVQVAAIHGNDHVSIAVAMALEKELGGWTPPWHVGGKAAGNTGGNAGRSSTRGKSSAGLAA